MTYEVGYGKPPKDSQFQKGKSGNPNGRPAAIDSDICSTDDTIKYIAKALRRKIIVTECGTAKRMTVLEAMIRRRIDKAAGDGDLKAFALVIKLAEKVELAVREGRTEAPLQIIIHGGLPND